MIFEGSIIIIFSIAQICSEIFCTKTQPAPQHFPAQQS